jgi:hypothetical protein
MKMSQGFLIRDAADWCIAIHFMPEGFLWSAKLYYYQIGLLGLVSSCCRVYHFVLTKKNK